MNAPESLAAPAGALIVARAPLDHFAPSLTNRKHKPEHITRLAGSIKLHKVIQPITARPWPDGTRPGVAARPNPDGKAYEIVVGEGRWQGSAEAGEIDIPFFWRDLTDKEAVELQLIENLQRDDISEIEEAEGYRRLMKEHGHTADTIAAEIGKSRAYVYARLKLLDLCPGALKLILDSQLDASQALLVARIPDPKLQEKAAKDIANGLFGSREPMSYRRAAEYVQSTYMLKLAEAPFSRADAELVPSAGRCHDCPKRTGNQAELYEDVKSADVCTDPACYDAKRSAHVDRQRAQAKAEGIKVIEGEAARKLKPHSHTAGLNGDMVDLDHKVWQEGKQVSVRQLLGKDTPAAEAIIIDPHNKGRVIEAVSKATIEEKLAAKDVKPPADIARRLGKTDAEKAIERKQKQKATYRQRLFDSTRGAIAVSFDTREEASVLDQREFQQIAANYFGRLQFEDQKRLARLWIGPDGKATDHDLVHQLSKQIPTLDRKSCARLMLEASIVGDIGIPVWMDRKPESLEATAVALGVIPNDILRGVIAENREKEKAKAAKKAPKKAKGVNSADAKTPPTPSQAAQAAGLGAQPAAPGKKPKAKATPAPTPSANEPAAPVKPTGARPKPAKPTKPEVRYRHPDNADLTWTGRGKQPVWVASWLADGKTLADLEVKSTPAPALPANAKPAVGNGDLFPDAAEFPAPNESGVYPEDRAEKLTWTAGKQFNLTITLLQIAEGWIYSTRANYKDGYYGGPLSLSHGQAWATRALAVADAVECVRDMHLRRDASYGYSAAQKTSLEHWLVATKAEAQA